MDALWAIATVALVAGIGIISPGPDFLAVSLASVTGSRRQAMSVAMGVVAGTGVWAAAALLGVGALFALFPALFLAIKLAGALYLMWLGVQMLRNASRAPSVDSPSVRDGAGGGSWAKGLATSLSNPKAALYFASALSSAAPVGASWWLLSVMVSAVVVVAALWNLTIVLVLTRPAVAIAFKQSRRWLEATFGVVLFSFGLRQLLARSQ